MNAQMGSTIFATHNLLGTAPNCCINLLLLLLTAHHTLWAHKKRVYII